MALSVEQAQQPLRAAAGERPGGDPHRLHTYVVLLLTTGLRPEEARALRWDHVDLEAGTVAVWRSDRAGGDTKTLKSRRTLRLAQIAVAALRQRKAAQAADRLKAGELWQDTGLAFTTTIGTMLEQHNIRRGFRQITKAAALGEDWVPRELRHTFVSTSSADGVPVEEIARFAGHQQTSTTELVYCRELRPVITTGGASRAGLYTAAPAWPGRAAHARTGIVCRLGRPGSSSPSRLSRGLRQRQARRATRPGRPARGRLTILARR
jgi:integrase